MQVFVLEFKMAEKADGTEAALAQMRDRGYAEIYMDRREPIHMVAIACGREAREQLDVRVKPAGWGSRERLEQSRIQVGETPKFFNVSAMQGSKDKSFTQHPR